MIIKSLELEDSYKFKKIEFGSKINLIYGDSDSGKTFIYKLIETVFGSEHAIDRKTIKKDYPKAKAIICKIENKNIEYIIRRNLYSTNTIIKSINETKEFNNLTEFGNYIFNLFSFITNVKLIKNKSLDFSRLTLREYAKFLFFSETRISEDKSFLLIDSYTSKTKYLNLFGYLLSGLSLNSDKLQFKTVKDDIKEKKCSILKYIKQLESISDKTINDEQNLKNISQLKKEIKLMQDEIDLCKKDSEKISNNITAIENEKFKLISLRDYYESENYDSILAAEFSDYLDSYRLLCPNCGNEVSITKTKDFFEIDSQTDLVDLKRIIEKIDEEYITNNTNLKNSKKKLDELECKINSANNTLTEIIEKNMYKKFYSQMYQEVNVDLSKTDFKILKIENSVEIKEKIDELALLIKKQLEKSELFGTDVTVSFDYDYKVFDFIINGQKRTVFGKGKRSYITTIFLLSLCKISTQTVGFIGFALIDSLYTSLIFEDISKKEFAFKTILDYMKELDFQIILVDNDKLNENYEKYDIKILKIEKTM